MNDTIRNLVECFGPSGCEDRIRDLIREMVEPHADDLRVDTLGNLIVRKTGDGSGTRIMLSAHMDEIGVIVSYIDDQGFVRVQPVGGVSPMLEVGGRVQFESGIVGVVSYEKLPNGTQVPGIEHLFVDVAAASRESCPVKLGEMGCFLQPMIAVGGHLTAKAMDDRIGCAILVETLRRLGPTPHEIVAVFTTQEEVGLRGATTAAFGVAPEIGIALDVTLSPDTPEPAVKMAIGLDRGPAIKIKDGGMIATPWVKNWMIDTAEANGIPYQLEVLVGGTTDARAMQTTRDGIASGCLSIPCRYVHSPSETVSRADVEHAVQLLLAMLAKPVPKA